MGKGPHGDPMVNPDKCENIQQQLHWYLDGELATEEKQSIELHLDDCACCRQQMQLLSKMKTGLRCAAQCDVPASLAARIQKETRSCTHGPLRIWGARLAVSGGALAACLMVSTFLSSMHERPRFLFKQVKNAVAQHKLQVPMDVASPDPQTVASFVRSRLGKDIKVPNLTQAGFMLRGGRVVSVGDEEVAQLRYRGHLGQELSLMAILNKGERLRHVWSLIAGDDEETQNLYAGLSGKVGDLPVMLIQKDGVFYAAVGQVAPNKLYAAVFSQEAPQKSIEEVLLAKKHQERLGTAETPNRVEPAIKWHRAFRSAAAPRGSIQPAVYRP
ncbi:MAG: hypothetical protein CMH56_07135 [Myxococcales bacterium]|nr:hypothetical protein [Myxococcales bacterium]